MGNKLTLYAIVIMLLTVIVSLPVLSCVPVMPDEINRQRNELIPTEAEVIIPDKIESMYWSRMAAILDEDALTLSNGNNDFSCDLYRQLIDNENGNFIYSPYSIFLAFAMVYAGAHGDTATEIANTLHYDLPADALPEAFMILNEELAQPGTKEYPTELPDGTIDRENRIEKDNYTLNIANALWGQEDYPFVPQYVELIDTYYGGGLESLNFHEEPEVSREIINDWISDKTEERIEDMLQPGTITPATVLVITNAIYFFSYWYETFKEEATEDKPFHLLDEEIIIVPTMHQKKLRDYAEGYGYKAMTLPYRGLDLDMIIILPDIDKFEAFEQSLDSHKLKAIVNSMESRMVDLALPKFDYSSLYENMGQTLQTMGIKDAFTSSAADFSGITKSGKIWIDRVIHQTFILVNEKGTEAAAATAITMVGSPPPPPPATFIVDHPFIYFIRHQKTGVILFMGRVLNPAE
jgi:serpin B